MSLFLIVMLLLLAALPPAWMLNREFDRHSRAERHRRCLQNIARLEAELGIGPPPADRFAEAMTDAMTASVPPATGYFLQYPLGREPLPITPYYRLTTTTTSYDPRRPRYWPPCPECGASVDLVARPHGAWQFRCKLDRADYAPPAGHTFTLTPNQLLVMQPELESRARSGRVDTRMHWEQGAEIISLDERRRMRA